MVHAGRQARGYGLRASGARRRATSQRDSVRRGFSRAVAMLACTAVVAVASSALAQDVGLLRSALEEVASIAGEPSVVSAGGITRDQTPLLTLENPTPFSEDAERRRLVLVGGLDGWRVEIRA